VEFLFATSLHISDFVQTQNEAKILTFCFIVKMTRREFVFKVHYGGYTNRRFMNTYVVSDIDVYKEVIE
jgi:hypothetical protein